MAPRSEQPKETPPGEPNSSMQSISAIQEYRLDWWQRSVLFLDVLRQQGNNSEEHNVRKVPHLLSFQAELVTDGRTLEHPVNYALARITPPQGVRVDPAKRPPEWHATMPAGARVVYEYWKSHLEPGGFRLSARVINYHGGMPRDTGLILSWPKNVMDARS